MLKYKHDGREGSPREEGCSISSAVAATPSATAARLAPGAPAAAASSARGGGRVVLPHAARARGDMNSWMAIPPHAEAMRPRGAPRARTALAPVK
jgi:hypothetical protein